MASWPGLVGLEAHLSIACSGGPRGPPVHSPH